MKYACFTVGAPLINLTIAVCYCVSPTPSQNWSINARCAHVFCRYCTSESRWRTYRYTWTQTCPEADIVGLLLRAVSLLISLQLGLSPTRSDLSMLYRWWARIEIFLWVGAILNTWNRCSTQPSIRTLVFTSPAGEARVNVFKYQWELKSFSVKVASASAPFWIECLRGRPKVTRSLELNWSVDAMCSWKSVSDETLYTASWTSASDETLYTDWVYLCAAANVGHFTRSSACILFSATI